MDIQCTWNHVFTTRPWGSYPGEELIRFTARNFGSSADRSAVNILEVGCGPGGNLWYFCREGYRAVGVDCSDVALERARQRLDREIPGWQGDLIQADISQLPLPDKAFDAAVDSEAICCNDFEKAKAIYAEMLRVLRPGGRLYSRTFARGSFGDGLGRSLGRDYWLPDAGPYVGEGAVRFTALEDIEELLGPTARLTGVERISRTMEQRTMEIMEWIIEAERV